MKKTKPRATRKKEVVQDDQYLIKNAYKAYSELQDDFADYVLDEIRRLDVKRQYQNELNKLERRYRNDAICFWIALVVGSSIIGMWIGLIANLIF